jgi:hypothetical protein
MKALDNAYTLVIKWRGKAVMDALIGTSIANRLRCKFRIGVPGKFLEVMVI